MAIIPFHLQLHKIMFNHYYNFPLTPSNMGAAFHSVCLCVCVGGGGGGGALKCMTFSRVLIAHKLSSPVPSVCGRQGKCQSYK